MSNIVLDDKKLIIEVAKLIDHFTERKLNLFEQKIVLEIAGDIYLREAINKAQQEKRQKKL